MLLVADITMPPVQEKIFKVKAPVGLMVAVPLFRILTVEPFIVKVPVLNAILPVVVRFPVTDDIPLTIPASDINTGLCFITFPVVPSNTPTALSTTVVRGAVIFPSAYNFVAASGLSVGVPKPVILLLPIARAPVQLKAFNVKAPVGLMVVAPVFRILTVEPFIVKVPVLNAILPVVVIVKGVMVITPFILTDDDDNILSVYTFRNR